jgi:hypothetical protein
MSYKIYRNWKIEMPAETYSVVGCGMLGRCGTTLKGTALQVDTDGDGKPDVKVEGEEGVVKLKHKDGPAKGTTYAARVSRKDGKGWKFAAAGAMVGKIDGVIVRLIDQNNNGTYNEFGKDAMIVGRGKVASFLSEIVHIGDRPLAIDVSADGRQLTYRPYDGPTGTLRVKQNTPGKLVSAIVRSKDGRLCFDLAKGRNGLRVPTGSYELHSGKIGLASSAVRVRRGQLAAVQVDADQDVVMTWGGPVRAEFEYTRPGNEIVFSPASIWFYGTSGEEYFGWYPRGKSPEFIVANAGDGAQLAVAILPGSG